MKSKIKKYEKEISVLLSKTYNDRGSVDIDVIRESQRLQTEIYFTKKKIEFLHKGKCYLGDAFGEIKITKN